MFYEVSTLHPSPDIIDPAILRPGRLDKTLFVGLPPPADRLAILQTITKVSKDRPCPGRALLWLQTETGVCTLSVCSARTSPRQGSILGETFFFYLLKTKRVFRVKYSTDIPGILLRSSCFAFLDL